MSVYTHVPRPPLCSFVEHIWLLDHHVVENSRDQLFPDGGIEIMFNLGEPQWLFEQDHKVGTCFRTSWVSGMCTKSIVISHGNVAAMVGVRFRPAGAYRFLKVPMWELADRVIDLDNLWGRFASQTREKLAYAPTPAARFAEIERQLLTMLAEDSLEIRMATRVANELQRQPNHDICGLACRLGIHVKQLQRIFGKVVGIKPKAFARVQRFQAAIREIGERPTVQWARLAAHCGYYDQPHFNREFREFTQLTPNAFLNKRGPYMNSVAVERGLVIAK